MACLAAWQGSGLVALTFTFSPGVASALAVGSGANLSACIKSMVLAGSIVLVGSFLAFRADKDGAALLVVSGLVPKRLGMLKP